MSAIRILGNENGNGWRVFIDGTEVPEVRSAVLELCAGDVAILKLEVYVTLDTLVDGVVQRVEETPVGIPS